jgi:filamentous hemagglutinin
MLLFVGATQQAKGSSPIYSDKSALDMLEKNGYLTPAHRQTLNQKWNMIPENVAKAFSDYTKTGWKGIVPGATSGTRAGGSWQNSNGQLPRFDENGTPITYREFDVNNKVNNIRDPERFVVGSDGAVYYTNNHYASFIKIK